MIEGLRRPFGVNQNQAGEIVVCDFGASEVLIYSSHFQKIRIIRNNHLIHPHSITFGPHEELIVCDYGSKKILLFSPGGDFISVITEKLQGPASCYLDGDKNFIVSDYGANSIKKFSATGRFIDELDGFDRPHSVDFDLFGNMYVADTWHHKVEVYSPSWNFIQTWPATFNIPVAISICGNKMAVSENGNGQVRCFDLLEQTELFKRTGFNMPYDVRLKEKRLLVADADNRRIYIEELI